MFEVRNVEDAQVLIVHGNIDHEHVEMFRDALVGAVLRVTGGRLVLHLGKTEYFHSSAMGVLANFYKEADHRKVRVGIVVRAPAVLEMFTVTRMAGLIPVGSTLEEVLDQFRNQGDHGSY